MSFDNLSFETVVEISSASPVAWLALAATYPPFVSYMLTTAGRAAALRAFGWIEIDVDGIKRWFLNKHLHHNGPAIVCSDVTKEWFQYGQLHRDGYSAIITPDGAECSYQHDELIKVE